MAEIGRELPSDLVPEPVRPLLYRPEVEPQDVPGDALGSSTSDRIELGVGLTTPAVRNLDMSELAVDPALQAPLPPLNPTRKQISKKREDDKAVNAKSFKEDNTPQPADLERLIEAVQSTGGGGH